MRGPSPGVLVVDGKGSAKPKGTLSDKTPGVQVGSEVNPGVTLLVQPVLIPAHHISTFWRAPFPWGPTWTIKVPFGVRRQKPRNRSTLLRLRRRRSGVLGKITDIRLSFEQSCVCETLNSNPFSTPVLIRSAGLALHCRYTKRLRINP